MQGGRSDQREDVAAAPRFSVCMVSDFFFPGMGGVEAHIYMLSQCLIKRGHKVIVLTRAYGDRIGIRYMTNGLKVYYLPLPVVKFPSGQVSLPSLVGNFPLFRNIAIRERVQLVHAHQASSSLGHECMMHAQTMGLPVCFTDHSLIGFGDASSIHLNKVLQFSLRVINHAICVSHISKENLVLRAGLNASKVSVIPNAVDVTNLKPNPRKRHTHRTTIVIMSRLVYRKGTLLLVEVLPAILRKHPDVDVIVGGDGPDRQMIEEMIDKEQLAERVTMLGFVLPSNVPDVLVQGHIFLNCSLTEAFCIAILEAASCGLLVVSTNVGGVPEVLPSGMMVLADPVTSHLVAALDKAIEQLPQVQPWEMHEQVASMYSWHNVAKRTERVYSRVCRENESMGNGGTAPLLDRLGVVHSCGPIAGKLFCMLIALDVLIYYLLCWLLPEHEIDIAPDFDLNKYNEDPAQHSDQIGAAADGGLEPSPQNSSENDRDLEHFMLGNSSLGNNDFDDDDDIDDLKL